MKKSLKALPLLAAAGLTLSAVAPVVFAQEGPITVVSREDGSGTRGAFVEIVGIEDENGNDLTTPEATIQNQTSGVMQSVANDPQSIGYISLGSLDDSVKAVNVDGAEATAEAIAAGDYPIARPFLLAWSAENELSDVSADFLNFIHSQEGQTVVEEEGYIAVTGSEGEQLAAEGEEAAEETEEAAEGEEAVEEIETASGAASLPNYQPTAENLEGTIEIVGSTSVTPIVERLAEVYKEHQSAVEINVSSVGSSAGVEAAINGTADFGMSSRALSEDEEGQVSSDQIAIDGIAVITHLENPVEELSLDAIRSIFLGEVSLWEDAVAQ